MRHYGRCRVILPDNPGKLAGGDAGPERQFWTLDDGSQYEPFGELNQYDGSARRKMRSSFTNARSQEEVRRDLNGSALSYHDAGWAHK